MTKHMRKLMTNIVAMGIAMGLACAAATAGAAQDTAIVDVAIKVLPFAEVSMDRTSVEIAIPAEATYYGPVYVGGTVFCNCSTTLFTSIAKPAGAPGDWSSYPVSENKLPAQGYDSKLLRIMVLNIPEPRTGWTGTLNVSGESVQNPGQIGTPAPGEVILTVMPG
jgi:hypothetical protein